MDDVQKPNPLILYDVMPFSPVFQQTSHLLFVIVTDGKTDSIQNCVKQIN